MVEAAADLHDELVGRDEELAQLRAFLGPGARRRPAVLVLEGEAGIGKTALWRAGLRIAAEHGFRVLAATPAASEHGLPFSGLRDVYGTVFDQVAPELPPPQRRALAVALLEEETDGAPPPQSAICAAALNATRLLAEKQPLLIAVDDLQWLDRPSERVLQFLARRLDDEAAAVLLARRAEHGERRAWESAATVHVGPLSRGAVGELLAMRLDPALPRWVVRRVLDVAAGNPLLALQIAPELLALPEPLAPEAPLPLPSSLQDLLRRRLQRLPERTRRPLLWASALSQPTRELIADAGALDAAVDAGVIEIESGRIRFTHPLLASVVYSQAPESDRRKLHRRLAEIVPDVEERARHLALAAEAPDPEAASELEHAAGLARARGAAPFAAELLERAIALAGDADPRRADRTIAAAEAWIEAGDFERPRASLEELVQALTPGPRRAHALWILATVQGEFGHAGASVALLSRALAEAQEDERLTARIEADLAFMELFDGSLVEGIEHARRSLHLAERIGEDSVLVEALSVFALIHFCAGRRFDEEILDRALRLEQQVGPGRGVNVSPQLVRGVMLFRTGDLEAAKEQFLANRREAIERGEEGTSNTPDFSLGVIEVLAGNAAIVGAQVREARALAGHTSVKALELAYVEALADAHLGRLDSARDAAVAGAAEAARLEEKLFVLRYLSLLGFVELSAGRFEAAEEALSRAAALAEASAIGEPGLLEFAADRVEALLALSRLDEAAAALGPYERAAEELGRPMGIALSFRCRGLIALAGGDVEEAVATLERAAAASERLQIPLERGRTLLALGIAQRRAKEKRRPREALEAALGIFESIGAAVWAERSRDELARIGGRARASDELTPTERRVAELVAQGRTNKEAAAELVVTVRAVESNLSRIYAKLGVRSRTELARVYTD